MRWRQTHKFIKKAINNTKPPTSRKEERQFIGVMNYYRNICPRRPHTLATLTKINPNKRKFKWTKTEQYSFKKIKRIVVSNNLSTYPDFNENFKMHTNASKSQLGPVISQKGKLIAFYSRKLTSDKKRYTVTERKLLRIVETLKKIRTILLG